MKVIKRLQNGYSLKSYRRIEKIKKDKIKESKNVIEQI